MEDELRTAKDELEIRVAERTAELEEANVLMSLEIDERRHAEEGLRATELRYRVLAEQIPAVTYVWSVDPHDDAAPHYTSPRIEQLLGYTVEEWRSHPDFWMSRLHPDDRRRVLATSIRSETTGEPFSMEYRYLHKDGHIVWVLDEAILLERDEGGKPRVLQGITLDITARKTAEVRATEADERYRTLVEQIPAITYIEVPSPVSPDETRLVYLSPQTREIVGYTAEELMADPSHLVWMLHPDDRDRVISLNASCERKRRALRLRISRDRQGRHRRVAAQQSHPRPGRRGDAEVLARGVGGRIGPPPGRGADAGARISLREAREPPDALGRIERLGLRPQHPGGLWQVRVQRLRELHRSVRPLMILQQRDERAAHRRRRAVQRVEGLDRACAPPDARLEPPTLVVRTVRTRCELAVLVLAGKPHLDVVLLRGAAAKIAGRDVHDAVGKLEIADDLLLDADHEVVLVP